MKLRLGAAMSGAAPPPPAATTWNAADKVGEITLSGGNLTAARNATTGPFYGNVRATNARTTPIRGYFENTVVSLTAPAVGPVGLGVANSSAPLTAFLGSDANGIAYFCDTPGSVSIGGVTIASIGAYAAGDRIDVAVDLVALQIWFRKNGGIWNGSAGADPATNVGGFSIASLGPAAYPAGTVRNTMPNSFTANFGAAAFAGAVPAGFAAWG